MTTESTNASADPVNDSHANGKETSAEHHGKGKDHSVANASDTNEKNGTEKAEINKSPSKAPSSVKEETSNVFSSDDDMPLAAAGSTKAKAQDAKDSKDDKPKSSDKAKDHKDTKESHKKEVKQDGEAKAPSKVKDEPKSKASKPDAEDSDDEKPISKLRAENAKAAKKETKPPAPASDSDDDKPIRALASKSPVKKEAKGSGKKRKIADSDSEDEPVKKPSKKPAKLSKNNSASNVKKPATSLKEWLIEKFLIRWWYVVEWPPKDRDLPKMDGYKELDHYPYLLFNEDTGHVKNCRTKENMPPCKEKYMSRSTDEMRKMAMEAIQKQMEVLKEHEPHNTELLNTLKKELKEVKGKTSAEVGV